IIANGSTFNARGTNTNNTFNFINCVGGSGSGGTNHGVVIASGATFNCLDVNPTNALNFINCMGGSGGASNYGFSNAASLVVSYTSAAVATLNFKGIVGGIGTGNGH